MAGLTSEISSTCQQLIDKFVPHTVFVRPVNGQTGQIGIRCSGYEAGVLGPNKGDKYTNASSPSHQHAAGESFQDDSSQPCELTALVIEPQQ